MKLWSLALTSLLALAVLVLPARAEWVDVDQKFKQGVWPAEWETYVKGRINRTTLEADVTVENLTPILTLRFSGSSSKMRVYYYWAELPGASGFPRVLKHVDIMKVSGLIGVKGQLVSALGLWEDWWYGICEEECGRRSPRLDEDTLELYVDVYSAAGAPIVVPVEGVVRYDID